MIDHSTHQTDLPLDKQVLNISVNLARIAYWTADSFELKKQLIARFMEQTDSYLADLSAETVSAQFEPTLKRFNKEFKRLKLEEITGNNKLEWAERALTWANILTARAKLA